MTRLIRKLLGATLLISGLFTLGCAQTGSLPEQSSASSPSIDLTGEWQLTGSTFRRNGETQNWFDPSIRMIKMFTDSHFAFVSSRTDRTRIYTHNPSDDIKIKIYGEFHGGAGRYELNGQTYTEHVEFCSVANYEGMSIPFKMTIEGDTLTQEGVYPMKALGFADSDGYLVETFVRVK